MDAIGAGIVMESGVRNLRRMDWKRNRRQGVRAYALVRSVILIVSTLAVVGVLFSFYQYSTGLKTKERDSARVAIEPVAPPELPDKDDDNEKIIEIGGQGRLGPGERIQHTWYEPGKTTPRLKAIVDRWEPVGEDSDEFYLVNPDVKLRTPEGQLVGVVADEAWVKLIRRGSDGYEARSGRFAGNVEIDIDRLSETERMALPENERDVPDPERMIHLTFDELAFDLERSQISTEGVFAMAMREATLRGDGLEARYNEVDRRLEYFEILRGGELDVVAPAALMNTSLPSGDDEGRVVVDARDKEVADDGEDREVPLVDESGIPIFIPGSRATKPNRPIQTYVATAVGDVSIQQRGQDETTWRLTADQLQVLFDFGSKEREATRLGKSPMAEDEGDKLTGDEGVEALPDGRVKFVWSETFTVVPKMEPRKPADEDEFAKKRLRLLATGDRVHFMDPKGEVTCQSLEVQRDTKILRIGGSEEFPLHVRSPMCQEMTGVELLYDEGKRVARLIGSARVADPSNDKPVDVRFDDYAELLFSEHVTTRRNVKTGEEESVVKSYVSTMTFVGDARMKIGADFISGDSVVATFDPPSESGGMADKVRTVDAARQVVLVREGDQLTCDEMKMVFAPDPGGRMVPRFAEATGNVFISQGTQTVSARDQLTMYMVPMVKAKKPFSMTEARLTAIRRGIDPAGLNWEKIRQDYEQAVEYTVGMESLTARGGVTAFDPEAGMDIEAETLACTFRNGRDIETADIEGPGDEDARVQWGDFSVLAHEVHVDRVNDRIDVPGKGSVWFVTSRGLDGTVSNNPQDVEITWSKEMRYLGSNNTARFVGDVHAVTRRRVVPDETIMSWLRGGAEATSVEGVVFDADELDVHFVDRDPTLTDTTAEQMDWWVFEPVANYVSSWGKESSTPPIAFDKEPSYVVASGDVVSVFSNVVPDSDEVQNRLRLASGELTVDMRSQQLTAPQAGSLLIEDYRMDGLAQMMENGHTRQPDRGLSVMSSPEKGLPSITYVTWQDSMTFLADRQRVDFDGDVRLDHRSGTKLPFAKEMLKDQGFDASSATNVGRRTRMTSGKLVVEFGAQAGRDVSSGGMGQMSFGDVRQLEATGGVAVDDDEVTIRAFRIVKYDDSDWLRILGSERQPAEIFSTTDSLNFSSPQMSYNLKTGAVDAQGAQQGRIRR